MAEDTALTTEMESGTDVGEAVGMEIEEASQEQRRTLCRSATGVCRDWRRRWDSGTPG